MSKFAWVTLATNDSYSLGALVVAHSLKRVGTAHQIAVLITPGVSDSMKAKLQDVFDLVQSVNVLDSQDAANLAVLKRPELGITFTKLHCWNLTQYEKCVFLDADVLIIQNCDELFEREELSAAADIGWPDIFNSGVFVLKPSVETYGKLIQFADSTGSFDGGDQGLLNQFFSDWSTSDSSKRLPFLYNTASTATYSYLPAFKHFSKDVKVIHFIGETKPWAQQINAASKQVQAPTGFAHLQDFLQLWWDLFVDKVHPTLTEEMVKENKLELNNNDFSCKNNNIVMVNGYSETTVETGIAGALANLNIAGGTASQRAYEDQFRRANWESGQIDYLGQDSFTNIWKKIQETIETPPVEVAEQRERKRSRSSTPKRATPPKEVVQVEAAASVKPVEAAPKPIEAAPKPIEAAPKPVVEKVQKTVSAPKPVASEPSKPKATPEPVAAAATVEKKKGDRKRK